MLLHHQKQKHADAQSVCVHHGSSLLLLCLFCCTGDTKSEETANKEAGEEKPEEDNDYHRSDEQVSPHLTDGWQFMFLISSPGPLEMTASPST